jgi:hypothetical protein
MPMFHSVVRHLNRQFDEDNIAGFAKNAPAFAPGRSLDVSVLNFPNKSMSGLFQTYLNGLPSGLQEVLRSVIYHALTASPPIPVSFSWAPAYDNELTLWHPPCGIMVQFRGPTPQVAEAA